MISFRFVFYSLYPKINKSVTDDTNSAEQSLHSPPDRNQLFRPIEKYLAVAFDRSTAGLVITQTNGTITYANKAFETLVGYSLNTLAAHSFSRVIHPDDLSQYDNPLSKLLSGESSAFVAQLRFVHKEEQSIWVKLHTTMLQGETGENPSLFSIVEEISQEVGLRNDQQKLLTLVDNSIELMSILELDGKNSYINKAGMSMLGFDNEQQVQQTPISQLHAPEHFEQVAQEVLPTVMHTGRWSGQMLVRHLKTGEIFPVFNNTIRIDDPHTGQPVAIGAVMRDQRPEVAAQRALEESELFARNVFHHSPIAKLVLVGEDMVIRSVNEKMLVILNQEASIIGKPVQKAIPALIDTSLVQPLSQVFASGETCYQFEVKIPLIHQEKASWAYYDFIFKALHDTVGKVYGVIVTASEVTAQVLARQKVEEAEAALQGAIELAQLGTWQMDLTTGLIDYSPRLRSWYGFTPDEVITQDKSFAAIRETDRAFVRESIAQAVATGSTGIYDIEYTLNSERTGQERVLRAQGKAYFNEAGKAFRLYGTVQDVTSQRRLQLTLEQQVQQRTEELTKTNALLRRSNENLQTFAYVASHDLQEPLRKIQQFGDLLTIRYASRSAEEQNYVARMQSAASRLSILIRDLLNFSRISARDDQHLPVSLNDIMTNVLKDLELVVAETEAVIQVDSLPTVTGNAAQLGQLFQNLLSNALKFRRPAIAPQIIVSAYPVAVSQLPASVRPARLTMNYYQIDVTDNGIGFDEKYLDRIFQVFQRLHSQQEYAGTGIGLAICEKVVINHGGALSATSQPGKGATFSVYLPQAIHD